MAKKVKLPSGAEVEITRPGTLRRRSVLAVVPSFFGNGGPPEKFSRDQLLETFDYQVAVVRAFTSMDDSGIDALEQEDFLALYQECEKLDQEARERLRPLVETPTS